MGLIASGIEYGSGFDITSSDPIDSRIRVEYKKDLTTIWNNKVYPYQGMIVTVMYSGETGKNALGEVYVLKGNNAKNESDWEKLVSGDGLIWQDFPTTQTTEQGDETTT